MDDDGNLRGISLSSTVGILGPLEDAEGVGPRAGVPIGSRAGVSQSRRQHYAMFTATRAPGRPTRNDHQLTWHLFICVISSINNVICLRISWCGWYRRRRGRRSRGWYRDVHKCTPIVEETHEILHKWDVAYSLWVHCTIAWYILTREHVAEEACGRWNRPKCESWRHVVVV